MTTVGPLQAVHVNLAEECLVAKVYNDIDDLNTWSKYGSMLNEMVLLQITELEVDLRSLRIRTMVIAVDMQSQQGCGVLQHVHWDLSIH